MAMIAVLAILAGLVVLRLWGLVGFAVAITIALVGSLIVWAVVMPGRLAPPVPTETLAEITDPRVRLEVADARTRLRHDLRNGALQLLTVLAVLIGAGLGFQQLAEDRDQASQDRQLTRQGQASERFTRAIDQLGSRRLETRIGGIYGLDQIAEQAPDNTGSVGEVLLAWLNRQPRPDPAPKTPLREHAPDIQAALTVLTGQVRYSSIIAYRLDLHGLGLGGANLLDAHLDGADLNRADLRDATLHNAQLNGAQLNGADLNGADLNGAKLNGAKLFSAHLRIANLRGVDLGGAYLDAAELTLADLRSASLLGANLLDATLRAANLRHADLRGADLRRANLQAADLRDVNLNDANLKSARLDGADLRGAKLNGADLSGATSDTRTHWPPQFDWRRAGVAMP